MTQFNKNNEFIHAIFAQLCSIRSIHDRLLEDFNILKIDNSNEIYKLSKIEPILLDKDMKIKTKTTSFKKHKRKEKKNNSQKKR